MTTYKVTYERDEGGWWIARVHGVAGVHSNGRTVEEARRRVREALSLAVDDADEARFDETVRLPAAARRLVERQQRARERAEREQAQATELQRAAAALLTDEVGLSRRDVGELLGISHNMVQKLVVSGRRKARRDGGAAATKRAGRK